MKPTQEQIDRRVAEARTQSSSSVLVALADKVAELERAAETSRAEHAAALGLATARIRELERERDELLGLAKLYPFGDGAEPACDIAVFGDEDDRCDGERTADGKNIGGFCWEHRRRAIVARIEKAAK